MPDVYVGLKKPLVQSCGIGEIGLFRDDPKAWDLPPGSKQVHEFTVDKNVTGCGWLIASFTPKMDVYEQAYKQLVKRFGEPIFQSEVRTNKRTNNKFFFCIFDTKGKE